MNNASDYLSGEIAKIKQFAIQTAKPTKHHYVDHWERVERFGIILAKKTGVNLAVVRAFAYLHDIAQYNDWGCKDHGKHAAELVRANSQLIAFFTVHESEQLLYAIENHTHVRTSKDATVNTCFDADRLDLKRIGITPIPVLMACEAGYYYAANPKELNIELEKLCH